MGWTDRNARKKQIRVHHFSYKSHSGGTVRARTMTTAIPTPIVTRVTAFKLCHNPNNVYSWTLSFKNHMPYIMAQSTSSRYFSLLRNSTRRVLITPYPRTSCAISPSLYRYESPLNTQCGNARRPIVFSWFIHNAWLCSSSSGGLSEQQSSCQLGAIQCWRLRSVLHSRLVA